MTVSTRPYFFWGGSGLNYRQPPYENCAPNCLAIQRYLARNYGGQSLGCEQNRTVREGSTVSDHAYGAAFDWRFPSGPITTVARNWMVSYSAEIGVNSIIDERPVGRKQCLMWYPIKGWHIINSGSTGDWLHVSVTPESFMNGSPIENRLNPLPPPPIPPTPTPTPTEDQMLWARFEGDLTQPLEVAWGAQGWRRLSDNARAIMMVTGVLHGDPKTGGAFPAILPIEWKSRFPETGPPIL